MPEQIGRRGPILGASERRQLRAPVAQRHDDWHTRNAQAFDVNSHGLVVGASDALPFVWAGGRMTPLRLLPGDAYGWAMGINDAGGLSVARAGTPSSGGKDWCGAG
jgi:hypothetical protein